MECRYCGQNVPEGASRCPNCNAVDPYITAQPTQTPAGPAPAPQHTVPQSASPVDAASPVNPAAPAGPAAPAAPAKKGSAGKALGGSLLRIVIGLVLVALVAGGFNVLHKHSSFLTKGDTVNMDELLSNGEDFPVGEFVHVDASFVLDAFATETSTTNGVTSKEDRYYMIVLNSGHAIAVKVGATDEIERLEKGRQDTLDYLNDKLSYFDDVPVEGKLKKLTDAELTRYFDEFAADYGFTDADSKVKPMHYMIDMTEVRFEKVLIFILIPAALIIIIAIIVSKKRKKAKTAPTAPAAPYTPAAPTAPYTPAEPTAPDQPTPSDPQL